MSLTEEEKKYIINEAVHILEDENRADLVKLLYQSLDDQAAVTATRGAALDKKKLDRIVWAVTKSLLDRTAKMQEKKKAPDK